MNKIVEKSQYSENVFKLVVEAPQIAAARRPGNFVIVRVGQKGERIPLTIAEADASRGTLTLVVQRVGLSTSLLCGLGVGDTVDDIVGPLGKPTDIRRYGTVLCAAGGVGTAPMLPIAQALKAAGNRVVSVLAGRTKELIIMEQEIRAASDDVVIMTDDGSYGKKGLVTQGMEDVIAREHIDKCFAIGPGVMMKFACLTTKKYGIPTDVSLNTIMVDGTGMCGACRVTVGGQTKFVCVDGPEFDGHEVDFDEMLARSRAYRPYEQAEMQKLRPLDADDARTAPWREELRRQVPARQRMSLERVSMPELPAAYRARSLREEVNRGLSMADARREAQRCLDCAKPGCVEGCPVGINIPGFVKRIELGDILGAARVLKRQSALPAVCGRVCPQERQCESKCIHLKTGGRAVAIGYLERFAADYERNNSSRVVATPKAAPNGIKVAAVGSGPSGLSFAGDMVRRGYSVTVFEALHEIGGVLKYGIPEFRLPNSIVDYEISNLRRLGVEFVKDTIVGKTVSVEQLKEQGYKGIFVGSGAGLPRFMGIEGENAINILSSNEYLTRVNLMDGSSPGSDTPAPVGKNVVVVGGGNTAMDSVRTALRLGARTATIVYRRGEDEMPARREEVEHARAEGVRFLTLHNPVKYISDEQGHVCQVLLQKMQLGEPDASGRRRPVPVDGQTELLDADLVIVSIGVRPNPIVPSSVDGLEVTPRGTIAVDEGLHTSVEGLYAGGDIVRGGATVILAMGDGKKAAAQMHSRLCPQA